MNNLIALIQNHKRDVSAALVTLAGAGHAIGLIWGITAPWFPKSLSTVECVAAVIGGVGWVHAAVKMQDKPPGAQG